MIQIHLLNIFPIIIDILHGHSVTHYFGHPGDVSTSMYSTSQKDLSHEKSNWFPSLQGLFLEGRHRLVVLYSAEMPDFYRLL
jgi:hypothetical protein